MNWSPNDLVTDADLLAYEAQILTSFNTTDWIEKRRRAIEDWLGPILSARGFDLAKFRTRAEPTAVLGYTGAVFGDLTGFAISTSPDDIDLAAVFVTPASDALYIGSTQPFRGVSLRLLEAVSAVSGVLTVRYWADGWIALAITDGTSKATGKTLSGGGAVTWNPPSDWALRPLSTTAALYWVKVTVSATPTGAKAAQIGCIRRSELRGPATLRTLTLIMHEAPIGPGPWPDKARWYETEADAALERALPLIGAEFDTDASDQISPTEATQTESAVSRAPFRLERA